MGKYRAPSLEVLLKEIDKFNSEISGNKERTKLFTILRTLKVRSFESEEQKYRVILGAFIYALKTIESTYKLRSPRKTWFGYGSDTYEKLLISLNMRDTPMREQDQFAYLMDFLLYEKEFNKKLKPDSSEAKDCSEIVDSTTALCQNLVIGPLKPIIGVLLKQPATQEAFLRNFAAMPHNYREQCKVKHNSNRDDFLKLIEFVDYDCSIIDEHAINVRYGLTLYILSQVEPRYNLSLLNWSIMFEQCKFALNIESSTSPVINEDTRTKYLAGTLEYILTLKPDQLKKIGLDDRFIRQMTYALRQQLAGKAPCDPTATSTFDRAVSTVICCAVPYGVSSAASVGIAQLVRYAASHYGPMKFLMAGGLSPVYLISFGLIALLRSELEPQINKLIAQNVSSATIYLFKKPFQISAEILNALYQFCCDTKDINKESTEDMMPFLLALRNAPNEVFKDNKKLVLENVVDFPTPRLSAKAAKLAEVEQEEESKEEERPRLSM